MTPIDEAHKIAAETIKQGIIGAWRSIALWTCGGALAFTAIAWAGGQFAPRDSTDTATERSGMTLRTDALTGCQYLESRTGYLTPRLDSDKMIICNEDSL